MRWLAYLSIHRQADGLQCRTLEVNATKKLTQMISETYRYLTLSDWPIELGKRATTCLRFVSGTRTRKAGSEDQTEFRTRFHTSVASSKLFCIKVCYCAQTNRASSDLTGRIERFFLDSLKEHSDIEVERGVLPESLEFDQSKSEDPNAYPIKVVLQHLSDEELNPDQSNATQGAAKSDGLFRSNMAADDTQELLNKAATNSKAGTKETVKAKYMIGCDGAHSWTRKQLGYKLEGEQTDYIW